MYKIKRIQKRLSVDIPWSFEKYPTSIDFLNHFEKNYVNTKKIIYTSKLIFSDDLLTCTSIQVWKSKEDFLDFLTDDCVYTERNTKSNYDINNDIINEFIINRV